MEYFVLNFLHVFFGILWAGAAVMAGLFIIPAVVDAGPAGGAVMSGVVARRFPVAISVAAGIVVLTGVRLYMIRYSPGWIATPEGLVITAGALLAIGAFAMGIFVQKPTAERLSALAAAIASSGHPPSPAQAAELGALRQKLRKIAAVTAWHLLGSALLMSMHSLVAAI